MDHPTTSSTARLITPLCGVYRITNSVTGDCYIGSSTDIHRRWRNHQSRLKASRHHNAYMQRAWLKYGAEAFSVAVLEICPPALLIPLEQRYLDTEQPAYNLARKAGQGPGMTGKKHSAATLAKLRAIPFSEDRRAKMRAAHVQRWTAEARERQSQSHLGHSRSIAARTKQGATLKGHVISAATREKIGAANAARAHHPHTPATIEKMRASQRARRERERHSRPL